MQPAFDFDRLQRRFRDPIQRRYESMRPVILWHDRTAPQRAEETGSHPATIGPLKRRFEQHGLLGLLPGHLHIGPAGRRGRGPEAVVQALERLLWDRPTHVYGSLLFTRSRPLGEQLRTLYPDAILGGTE